jgi:hypothetical protein
MSQTSCWKCKHCPTLKETFEISILIRQHSTDTFPTGVTVVKVAYTEDELVKVFQGQGAIVSAVGAGLPRAEDPD